MAQGENQKWKVNTVLVAIAILLLLCISPFYGAVIVWLGMIAFSYYK